MQVEPSKSDKVTQSAPGVPMVWQVTQAKSAILIHRFMIPSKNGSRNRLNHPNRRRSIFKLPGFHEYFAFYSLIREDTNLGPPDLDSPPKYASGDI